MKLTKEQTAAIESSGKTIVSASAGSGKTFVMIRKLVGAIENGTDLDSVLAVTFTKKAAAQMKDKLRSAIIEDMAGADGEKRERLKVQLSKVASASISTIHSLCAKLLRTYFYTLDIDGTFDIISADDPLAQEYMSRALDGLFERYYDEGTPQFMTLLSCYRRKRGDVYLKNLILAAYEKLRINAGYTELLDSVDGLYTEEGFKRVCAELKMQFDGEYAALLNAVGEFEREFVPPRPEYSKIIEEMKSALKNAINSVIFAPQLPLTVTRKPSDRTEAEKAAGEQFKTFKDNLAARYKAVRGDISDENTERERFLKSGEISMALAYVLKQFDAEYTAVKRDENKLDYNDLEHLTLKLLQDEHTRREINSVYKCVFVDEYQDVNPVQEEIITRIGGENVFLVGDVKQAIYGFRGSKSLFFAEKYNRFEGGGGNALRLTSNFRSSDAVLEFVNSVFSSVMTVESCGFDYARGSMMSRGGGYPENYGTAEIHVFGKEEEQKTEPAVYSVKSGGRGVKYSREGLAVLEIVKRELKGKHFDLKSGEYVDTQVGDICILTRKRNKGAAAIVRALTEVGGYNVAGAQEQNILLRPEVKQMIDILSYIDNVNQDIPMATAMLSPLGGFTCDELAAVRIASKGMGRTSFRVCCKRYAQRFNNSLARKIICFNSRIDGLRDMAEILSAAEIIDVISDMAGFEASYSADGGQKLKNLRRLAAEGANISVCELLAKIKGGYEISAPSAASGDAITVMTMHAAKGLEFPVVIIADICATFKGRDAGELLFDERFGFAPRYYDPENMLTYNTLLRNLAAARSGREELVNEYNLFYVACTRAMCHLHIMAEEAAPFKPLDGLAATSYSKIFDMFRYNPQPLEFDGGCEKTERVTLITEPDGELLAGMQQRFMREYKNQASVNLPVKSSASAILRLSEEDHAFRVHELFPDSGETGAERGTAYHRYLELCDFNIKDTEGISREIEKFTACGKITAAQRELISAEQLSEILNMPVFAGLGGAELYREREFLCRLPADSILETTATDPVLVQGAIDLLAVTRGGVKIIDYKYSKKNDEQLINTYYKQLALYKKAVALIMGIDESSITTTIVNIHLRRQIDLKVNN